jgi:GSCFA family
VESFFLPIQINGPSERIHYPQKLLLTGSCFTEHIGQHLSEMKFGVLQNPNGILFDPLSVAKNLISWLSPDIYRAEDLFFFNELWQSWNHHGVFSGTSQQAVLSNINFSQQSAHAFLKHADWLIITLGSSFSYYLKEQNRPVANCHRAPSNWFTKRLLSVEEMLAVLDEAIHRLVDFNPKLQIVFTISPVRHIRDGVIENNRSKARLIEVAHQLVSKFNRTWYFPAYELVIDVLRDYRFYDKDLVHPNYMATNFVVEHFMEHYMDPDARILAEEIRKLQISRKHRPLHPDTGAHRRFLEEQYAKTVELSGRYPFLDFKEELHHFSGQGN